MRTLVKHKHKTMFGGQKKIVFGCPKEGKGEKAFRKGKNKFSENDSRTFLQDKGSDKEFQSNKGTSEDQSRRGKESSFSQ